MKNDRGSISPKRVTNDPQEILRIVAEWKTMAEIFEKAGNHQMAQDCLDNAFIEELRIGALQKGITVIAFPYNV